LNKKAIIIIAVSIAISIGIMVIFASNFSDQVSTKNPQATSNKTNETTIPVTAGRHITINLNESMHFATR